MPVLVKIERKIKENYAEMAAGHPGAHECATEKFFDHSDGRERGFSTRRHPSSYLNYWPKQTKFGIRANQTPHN
jgi:hypothetical protein